MRIVEEDSSSETYDPMSAITKWSIDKVRNVPKKKDDVTTSHVILLKQNLTVMMTVTMRNEIFLKMGMKKDICFLLIPNQIIIFFIAKCTAHNCVMLH